MSMLFRLMLSLGDSMLVNGLTPLLKSSVERYVNPPCVRTTNSNATLQAGGKEDGAQGVGVEVTKVQDALEAAKVFYSQKV